MDQDEPMVGINPPKFLIHEEEGKRRDDRWHHPLGEDPERQVVAPA
jgi:hypothetical protein